MKYSLSFHANGGSFFTVLTFDQEFSFTGTLLLVAEGARLQIRSVLFSLAFSNLISLKLGITVVKASKPRSPRREQQSQRDIKE